MPSAVANDNLSIIVVKGKMDAQGVELRVALSLYVGRDIDDLAFVPSLSQVHKVSIGLGQFKFCHRNFY